MYFINMIEMSQAWLSCLPTKFSGFVHRALESDSKDIVQKEHFMERNYLGLWKASLIHYHKMHFHGLLLIFIGFSKVIDLVSHTIPY